MSAIAIRPEEQHDALAITALTDVAFRDCTIRTGSEARIIERLRRDGQLALSLVAENVDLAIIGHLAASPVTISDNTQGWFALGPASVIPLNQKSGIGSALMERAIIDLKEAGAKGLVGVGDPDCFGRFGFERDENLIHKGSRPDFFLRLPLVGESPKGLVSYAPAFDG